MQPTTETSTNVVRRIYVLLAWGSPASAAMVVLVLWLWFGYIHEGHRGVRADSVLAFYLMLLAVNAIASLAGMASVFGIRSWRGALIIVPGAILGVISNLYLVVVCLMCYLLEGKNMSG